MSEDASATPSVDDAAAGSADSEASAIGKLNAQHLRLSTGPQDVSDEVVARIIADARTFSGNLFESRDRATANRIARFWSAEAARRQQAEGFRRPEGYNLFPPAAPEPAGNRDLTYTSPPLPPPRLVEDDASAARSRTSLRLAFQARQWRTAGKPGSLLLSRSALAEAKDFAGNDRDIAELVSASEKAVVRGYWAMSIAAGLVVGIAGLAVAYVAHRGKVAAEIERDQFRKEAISEAERRTDAERKIEIANSALERERRANASLRAELAVAQAASRPPEPPPPSRSFTGYAETFFSAPAGCTTNIGAPGGPVIPLPSVHPDMRASLARSGEPLAFMNYSVMFSAVRRLPVFAGANICRSQLQGVGPEDQPVRPTPDLPDGIQIPDAWYRAGVYRAGRIVSPRDIAWVGAGAGTGLDNEAAALALAQTDVAANAAPFTTEAETNWQALRRYAATGFNPSGTKVSVFAGPVFDDEDRQINGIAVPQAYWIVMVGVRPDRPAEPVVESYLLPWDLPLSRGLDDKEGTAQRLLLQATASTLRDISARTGLVFPDVLLQAERVTDGGTRRSAEQSRTIASPHARQLAASVSAIDDKQPDVRRATTQLLISALRDNTGMTSTDRRVILEAALALLPVSSFAQLSPNARVNLALILAQIPEAVWNDPDLRDLKARARRGIIDIPVSIQSSRLPAMPSALGHLDAAKARLGFDLANNRIVYIQFADMTRVDAELLRGRLQELGWQVPGTERTAKADRLNEIRFRDTDSAAARQLADDLRLLGREVEEKRTNSVNPGKPEIWISGAKSR